jgi:rhodanese-related sulfurtransferase
MNHSIFEKGYEDLNGSAFRQNFENTSGAVLLDVRTPMEFNSGNIAGSLNIDIMGFEFQDQVSKLDKNKTYFIYCRSGNRSGQACAIMSEMGFKTFNLIGGIGAWPFN